MIDKIAAELNDVWAAFKHIIGDPLAWGFFLCVYGPVLYCMWLMGMIR